MNDNCMVILIIMLNIMRKYDFSTFVDEIGNTHLMLLAYFELNERSKAFINSSKLMRLFGYCPKDISYL